MEISPPSNDPSWLGNHLHIRLNGTSLDEDDKRALEILRPIGVQLSKHNFQQDAPYSEWLEALDALLSEVKERTGRDRFFVSIDHEGGRIHRLPAPLTHFSSTSQYRKWAEEVGLAMAVELRSIGVNLNFAPCCDIHSNPNNPVIGARAFGSSPQEAAEGAAAFLRGLQSGGVLGCLKHFPGHGDTSVDSHLELPKLELSVEQLKERELFPYEHLLNSDLEVGMVMTAHILFPALDEALPATLSEKVLFRFLRKELSFDGVVISDDLDMNAIADHFTEDEIAAFAFRAGCDLLLFNHTPLRAEKTAHAAFRLINEGVLSEHLFTQSQQRILNLLSKTPSRVAPYELSRDTLQEHDELRKRASKDA